MRTRTIAVAIGFKRDCYEAWTHRIDEGYTPEQIIAAYVSYSRSYESRRAAAQATYPKHMR